MATIVSKVPESTKIRIEEKADKLGISQRQLMGYAAEFILDDEFFFEFDQFAVKQHGDIEFEDTDDDPIEDLNEGVGDVPSTLPGGVEADPEYQEFVAGQNEAMTMDDLEDDIDGLGESEEDEQ